MTNLIYDTVMAGSKLTQSFGRTIYRSCIE